MVRYAALAMALMATPALAQFPPPGVYGCKDAAGSDIGVLTLYVGGDYMWDGVDGSMGIGQMGSAGDKVEAITGPLKTQNWIGGFAVDAGTTRFAFETKVGPLGCA
ncbi:MAG: hypothetical protein ABIO40_05620 [Devosia sp.]